VGTVFSDGGREVVAGVDVELRERGVHTVEFVVKACKVGFRVPGREGVVTRTVHIGYHSSPC
jgi:hypothetical protein